jgi:hypothetical protein
MLWESCSKILPPHVHLLNTSPVNTYFLKVLVHLIRISVATTDFALKLNRPSLPIQFVEDNVTQWWDEFP